MNYLKKILLLLCVLMGLNACNSKISTKQMVLTGNIEGYKNGTLTLLDKVNNVHDSVQVKNGSFVFKKEIKEPTLIDIYDFGGGGYLTRFIAENESLHLTGKSEKSSSFIVSGGHENAIAYKYNKALSEVHRQNEYENILRNGFNPNLETKERSRLDSLKSVIVKKTDSLEQEIFKNHSDAVFCAYLAYLKNSGKGLEETKSVLSKLSPSLNSCYLVKLQKESLQKMENYDVKLDEIVTANNIEYRCDSKFKGNSYKNINYLSILSNNTICASHDDGTIKLINTNGSLIKSFKAKVAKKINCIAVDKEDLIYTVNISYKDIKRKVRGKIFKHSVPDKVECNVYNQDGDEIRNMTLIGLKNAAGVKIVGNKLLVSDNYGKYISIFNKENGKFISKIEDMRPCCGMLDFTITSKNELLVANLGAFRVQAYNLDGKKLYDFGSRGREINEFHGCCNPVSVATLGNGAIVTVEKDPTRIKVYSKNGAKKIQGIEELVKGCMYIPMVVDGNDNLYLASPEKGLVKCIAM